jgi:hypothetical protein
MKKSLVLLVVTTIIVAMLSFSIWVYWSKVGYSDKIRHETDSWAVIEDSNRDVMAVETTEPGVWDDLVYLRNSQTEMWIGGVVEEYDNYWGFRFRPDSIVVAEVTIEDAQSNIRGISGDLSYWINVWAKEAYVFAKVLEIHQ